MIDKYLNKLEYNVIIENLLEICHTYIGKDIATNLKPFINEDKVSNLLKETTDALTLNHSFGTFPIGEIDDLSISIKRIESGFSLSAKALLDIAAVLKTSRELINYSKDANLDENSSLYNYFYDLYQNEEIEKRIFKSILSEDTISDEASPKLSAIRRNRKNIELEIRNRLNGLIHSNTYSKYIMDAVITIRNGRFVIPVKEEYRSNISGFIHDTSSSGSTVYIEPMSVFEMNNTISNLLVDENREIERIIEELSAMLYPISNYLKNTISLIGKLDFINAKARLAISQDSTCPKIDNYIDLKNARHPIIDKNKVVPINVYVGKSIKNNFTTLVITGPNTGGKTVTLKTVGLLCAMAQSGLHIPVSEGSTIKVFDNIFADIGDEQSIEESLSTFSAHITNIVQILNTFTDKSLILVDELGSGTDPVEGASLAISLLEHFHNNGATTIATTHYHEIKNYCIINDGFENASCEFDIKTLKPTYHLLMGIPGKSNAFSISKKLGISQEIISRASSLISQPEIDIETLMKEIYDDKAEIEKEKLETQKNLNQIETLRKSLEHENSEKLAHEQEKIEKAKREAKEILLNAKEESDEIIRNLNKLNAPDVKKANYLRNKLNDSIKKASGNELDLSVLLQLNNQYSNNDKKTLSNNSNSKVGSVHIENNKAKDASTEINLLGEDVATATEILDKYLDSCTMAHLHQVRIVHGKGTGKLRQGIHQYLKKCKYVESFNLAGYGEGDYGVTIVYLK